MMSGNEPILVRGKVSGTVISDFWKWGFSNVLDNTLRGVFAEFLVATALNIDVTGGRKEWDSFDLMCSNGMKVEVKSAAFIQSWEQEELSTIRFSIKATRSWDVKSGYSDCASRQADVYVFCLLMHKDRESINPLDMAQWKFYVLPTKLLNDRFPVAKTISLKKVKELSEEWEYDQLADKIIKESSF